MSDELTVETEAPEVSAPTPEPTNATGSGQLPAGDTPKTMTLTQEEFDAKIKERIERAAAKAQREAEKVKSEAEAKALAERGEFQKLYEAERDKAARLETEKRELELSGWRRDAAAQYRLPAGFAERLKGETLEELEADAKVVAALLPKPGAPNTNDQGNGLPSANGNAKQYAERLGINPKHWPASNG